MTVFFSQLINGLSLGSIYALIALGYSMVYGIILLLNFAHGDVIMVGAYMSWFVMNQLGLGPVTAVCATIITCTLLGVVIEKVAYTPLRNAPRISLLITAIGVSFFLEYTAELVMGSGAKVIPSYYGNKTFMIGSVPLGLTSVITLVVTVLSMLVLTFLVQKTKLGKAMRAVSEDMDAARLMGINVNSTISFTFAVGSALAGIGSVLYCCQTAGQHLPLLHGPVPAGRPPAAHALYEQPHGRGHQHRPDLPADDRSLLPAAGLQADLRWSDARLRHDGPLYGNHPFRPVPARGAGHPVFPLAGRERHLAVLACGLVCGHRALHGVLSYLYLPAGRRKNDAVTFLTWVKALHFTMKQSEQNEKITKNDTVFLVAFT